jgi:glycosyltransferase involved in cell wall biosynthesis
MIQLAPSQRPRIAHLTSVHVRHDTRIFWKQCRSLQAAGYEVHLIVADGKGDEVYHDVHIHDVGKSRSFVDRVRNSVRRVADKACELKVQVCQLHDPELLQVAGQLAKSGSHVVFDAHEDFPVQLLGKAYLPGITKTLASTFAAWYERRSCRTLSAIITATETIANKFKRYHRKVVNVRNYPLLSEFEFQVSRSTPDEPLVTYVGDITRIRGVLEMVQALPLAPGVRMNLAGRCPHAKFFAELESRPGWQQVNWLGFITRSEIESVFARSVAGLVTLHPTISYVDALPVKMFEYMAAGLPVIASNFPILRQIVETEECGFCVDPLDPIQIAEAIRTLQNDPKLVQEMGQRGQRAVRDTYNWGLELPQLLGLYSELTQL